jgi:hypothetical protein
MMAIEAGGRGPADDSGRRARGDKLECLAPR